MLTTCWSVKGGSGTTVVAAALSLLHGRSQPSGALLVDLEGDGPAVLGLNEPTGPGLDDWLHAAVDLPVDALARLEVDAAPGVRLIPRGGEALAQALVGLPDTAASRAGGGSRATSTVDDVASGRGALLGTLLSTDARSVIVDAGRLDHPAALDLAAGADQSLLVIRPCYLALRRAVAAPLRPSGVVLLVEPGRALGRADVEHLLGVDVKAEVAVDPAVARAVDAGLLAGRLPRRLARGLRDATWSL